MEVTWRAPGGDAARFGNLVWEGLVHAGIQDAMVAPAARREGIGT
jgi:hypothetical protein